MADSAMIARYIPFLRRFAARLPGSQAAGDAYVVATLEAIVADPEILDGEFEPQGRAVPSVLADLARRSRQSSCRATNLWRRSLGRQELAAIPMEPRVAFLLSAVESFTTAQIAQTLDCSERHARDLIDRAGRDIAAQIRTNALIIEDEPLIALDLQTLVEQLGHEVTTIARTHTEAVRAALESRPGVILADIQLADGSSGLEAVNEFSEFRKCR